MANRSYPAGVGTFFTILYFGFCGVLVDLDHFIECGLDWHCAASGETSKFWHHYPGVIGWAACCLAIPLAIGFIHHVAGHASCPAPKVTLGD